MSNNNIIDDLYGNLEITEDNRKWFVIYTRARHEKKVAEECRKKGITYYLPLKDSIRRYKYRKLTFQKPLFPCYIFCCCNFEEKRNLRSAPPLTRFLEVLDQKGLINDLLNIKNATKHKNKLIPHKFLKRGQEVKIISGPFKGLEGKIQKKKGANKIILNINAIQQAVALEIDKKHLKLI